MSISATTAAASTAALGSRVTLHLIKPEISDAAGRACALTAAGLRAPGGVPGAHGSCSQHARGSVTASYALSTVIDVLSVRRHQLRQPQLSQAREFQELLPQQQQTLWLPGEHQALLQSQIEPAQTLQTELTFLQLQQPQQTRMARRNSSGGPVPAGAPVGLHRALLVTGMAAAAGSSARQQPPSVTDKDANDSDNSSNGAGIRERMQRRMASRTTQSASSAAEGAGTATSSNQSSQSTDLSTGSSSSSSSNGNIRSRLQQQLATRNAGSSSIDGTGRGSSNDSNIAAVLQQLQQKLGQRFSPKVPTQHTAAPAAAGTPKQSTLQRQQQQPGQQSAHQQMQQTQQHVVNMELHQTTTSRKLSSRQRTPRTRPLRAIPQSSIRILEGEQEYVQFSGGKLRHMYPDQVHTGFSLLQLQEATATPLADLQKVLDWVAAPEPVRLRLVWDWRCSPRMPPELDVLQQQLNPFDQIAELLGGEESATQILSMDSTYMVMQLPQLQERLMNLQRLMCGDLPPPPAAVTAPGVSRTAAAAAAASVASGRSSLAAIRKRLTSRQQQQTDAPMFSAASLQTNSSSSSSSGSGSSSRAGTERISEPSGSSSIAVYEEALTLVRYLPGILWLTPKELHNKLSLIQHALALNSAQEVLQIVLLQPSVLDASEAELLQKVTALATSLQLSVAQAQLLVSKQPLLLNLSAKTLTQRVSDLADVLGLPPRVLAKLVTAKPSVMLFNPNKMRTKSIRLQCIAGTYQHWAAELKARLGPGSLVQLLTVGDKRLMRAEYLVSIKAQHKQSMLYTVQVQSDQAFNQKFPGFEQWYRERKQQSKHEK